MPRLPRLVVLSVSIILLISSVHGAREWAVEFGSKVDLDSFLDEHSAELVDSLRLFSSNSTSFGRHILDHSRERIVYLLRDKASEGSNKRSLSSSVASPLELLSPKFGVKYVVEQVPFRMVKRLALPYSDPLLPMQWHLHNVTLPRDHVHLNVLRAWELGYLGSESVIAFIDDGIEVSHPDLNRNWNFGQGNRNYNSGSSDITPRNMSSDAHGTAVAGLAVAVPDGDKCGVGVAPNATFTAIVLLQREATSDMTRALALKHAFDINHIYSNSWGPPDDGLRLEAPLEFTAAAILDAVRRGRSGRGSIYMWAAGNGRKEKDNCNYDGYASSRYVNTIGSVTYFGTLTTYSEPCAALLVVLPSGNPRMPNLYTTDLHSSYGFNSESGASGDCTNEFAGTSASTGLAAGLAALILDANKQLSWLDLQYVLKLSAVQTDPKDPSWFKNGAGTWVSHDFGFGIPNATRAVLLARDFTTSLVERIYHYDAPLTDQVFVPPNALAKHLKLVNSKLSSEYISALAPSQFSSIVVGSVDVTESLILHHVELVVQIQHSNRGHLDIRLFSPSGTVCIFAEKHGDTNANYSNWKFTSRLYWGEQERGNWTLVVKDTAVAPDTGAMLRTWNLTFFGLNEASVLFLERIQNDGDLQPWDIRSLREIPNPDSKEIVGIPFNYLKFGLLATLIIVFILGPLLLVGNVVLIRCGYNSMFCNRSQWTKFWDPASVSSNENAADEQVLLSKSMELAEVPNSRGEGEEDSSDVDQESAENPIVSFDI